MIRPTVLAAGCAIALASAASAQTLGPSFVGNYAVTNLGAIQGVLTNYGGITFLPDDPDTLLIGGLANNSNGRIFRVPVVRDAEGHITGFGTPADHCAGANNDGGLDFAPNGTLFVARFPINTIGQVLPGQSVFAVNSGLNGLNISGSMGGLKWVPDRQPGAGRFKVASFSSNRWYDVSFTENK